MSAEKHDIDPIETQEWLDALSSVLENEGSERAHFLLENLQEKRIKAMFASGKQE